MTDNTRNDPPIYRSSVIGFQHLYQGEILSGLVRFELDVQTIQTASQTFTSVKFPFVLVVSQACDLDWDFKARNPSSQPVSPDKLIPSVMFCEAQLAAAVKQDRGRVNSTQIWNNIKTNRDVRYQFLESIGIDQDTAAEGIGELCLDFKRYFTIPTAEVYRRIELGHAKRRAVLLSPYVEHLSDRFAHYIARVGLPRDHESEKPP